MRLFVNILFQCADIRGRDLAFRCVLGIRSKFFYLYMIVPAAFFCDIEVEHRVSEFLAEHLTAIEPSGVLMKEGLPVTCYFGTGFLVAE